MGIFKPGTANFVRFPVESPLQPAYLPGEGACLAVSIRVSRGDSPTRMTKQKSETSLPKELTGHLTEVLAAPEMGNAWVALGQALKAAGRGDEAGSAYHRAIRHEGMNALARMGLGELSLAAGRPGLGGGEITFEVIHKLVGSFCKFATDLLCKRGSCLLG